MKSFLVIGDGFASSKVASAVDSLAGARLAAIISTTPPKDGVFTLPGGGSVEAVGTEFLTREAGLAWVSRLKADWLLCINSTVLLPAELLRLFGEQALNCHPGPLPEYAGLHAHQWAIRNGASEYGVTVHRMEARIDAGPIVTSTRFPIRDNDTGLSLYRRTMAEASELLVSLAGRIAAGETLPSLPQDLSRRRIYRHREALDGRIDWQLPARSIINFVRAGNYEPFSSPSFVATFEMPSGVSVEVLRCEIVGTTDRTPGALVDLQENGPVIACGDGNTVRITRARNDTGLMDAARWHHHFGHPAGSRS